MLESLESLLRRNLAEIGPEQEKVSKKTACIAGMPAKFDNKIWKKIQLYFYKLFVIIILA